jgi:hypothetical protein
MNLFLLFQPSYTAKTLIHHLFHQSNITLNWKKCFQISNSSSNTQAMFMNIQIKSQISKGLNYLKEDNYKLGLILILINN